jgi:hypothetical protein
MTTPASPSSTSAAAASSGFASTTSRSFPTSADIGKRYGCWKGDIAEFAEALVHAGSRGRYFIGETRLHELLAKVGMTIPIEQIAYWTQQDRHEAEQWALLRIDFGGKASPATEMTVPAKVAEALGDTQLPFAPAAAEPAPEPDRSRTEVKHRCRRR